MPLYFLASGQPGNVELYVDYRTNNRRIDAIVVRKDSAGVRVRATAVMRDGGTVVVEQTIGDGVTEQRFPISTDMRMEPDTDPDADPGDLVAPFNVTLSTSLA